MSEAIIKVETLSKRYLLSHQGETNRGLRHVLNDALSAPFRRKKNDSASKKSTEEFWALKDVSFEIKRGEVVGIIGRNGAGKSTLLKILSRITEPTSGRIELNGRVASLLEVGTGFHPELTGRENIFLNGAILGMSRVEIKSKFDEIVAFAEVEKFLDTPVKRYSSGMYVRLAFAVAAHLDPEILIIDEVLAVGDAAFQKKCLGKMKEVSQSEGRTVLFVSHQMSTIAQLCRTGIYLKTGQIKTRGTIDQVIQNYLMTDSGKEGSWEGSNFELLRKKKKLFFRSVALTNNSDQVTSVIDVRQPIQVRLTYEVPRPLERIELSLRVLTAEGRPVFTSLHSDLNPNAVTETRRGQYEAVITIPGMLLMPGGYLINVAAHEPFGEIFDVQEGIIHFTVNDTGTNFARYGGYSTIGVVLQNLPWQHQAISHETTR